MSITTRNMSNADRPYNGLDIRVGEQPLIDRTTSLPNSAHPRRKLTANDIGQPTRKQQMRDRRYKKQ
jgi:hypothetical protein